MSRVLQLMSHVGRAACQCPAHSSSAMTSSLTGNGLKEYAFEMASSNIRYGPNVTQEIGMDLKNINAKRVCLVTDKNISRLSPVKTALDSLHLHHVIYEVYDDVRVEPTSESFEHAIAFARRGNFDAFLAIGGGSVIDTAKACNLYSVYDDAPLLRFVNAPIGEGAPIDRPLKPLFAVPTTAGTGSETTGVAIFDYLPLKAKTGIASRALRPTLGLVDPLHMKCMPQRVAVHSGFDVLCHALESFTAVPFSERTPRPSDPIMRPAYQGSNPISDIWSRQALHIIHKYFKRSCKDPEDTEARSEMHLASCYAGIGFGNAGVHLCHGMSYPISGLNRDYKSKDYPQDHPLIPHGLSVVITSPAVFEFTSSACPDRHIEAAQLLLGDLTKRISRVDSGLVLGDILRKYMNDLRIENGLSAFGFSKGDIPALVKGTLPQERVLKISPRRQSEEDLAKMLENSMTVY